MTRYRANYTVEAVQWFEPGHEMHTPCKWVKRDTGVEQRFLVHDGTTWRRVNDGDWVIFDKGTPSDVIADADFRVMYEVAA